MISKSLSTSQRYARLFEMTPDIAEFAQSLYPLLMAHSDDFGRQAGDLFTVKHKVHPASPRSPQDFERALAALHKVGLIVWYPDAHGGDVIQMVKFDKHQQGLHKRTRSDFPRPPVEGSGNFREVPAQVPGSSHATEENRTELNRREEDQEPVDQDPRPSGRMLALEIVEFADAKPHLRAATHGIIEANPSIEDSELAARVKDTAGELKVTGYLSRDIEKLIEGVRRERAKRSA